MTHRLGLLAILALALALRWSPLFAPLQQDEFGPLYAIAERPDCPAGWLPGRDDPLVLVGSWREVGERSVLPYGIVPPVPLYHGLLYAVAHVLPLAEWSLRLPSLVAGLLLIVLLYLLGCRLAGVGLG